MKKMSRLMKFIASITSCIACIVIIWTHFLILVDSKTLQSDIQVLRAIKSSIDPSSISSISFLNTWNFDIDPCEETGTHFLGVLCNVPGDKNSSSRITAINLEGDGLEGFLTPVLGNLTEVTSLDLRRNKFRGPIPSSIANMQKITRLLLSENFFSGSIPSGILTNLKALEVIDLSQNRLSGSIPSKISDLRSLSQLTLAKNQLSGRIPDLTVSWQLSKLDLSSNQLLGNLPQFPKKLSSLSLGHNLFSGHISSITRLQHLRSLDISNNRFRGIIDQGVFTLPEIVYVNVSSNRFTTIMLSKASNRPSLLQVIDAQDNRLHGRLPKHLVTYQNLTTINLSRNLFSGRIPKEYGERLGQPWRNLFLENNLLQGNLPSGFSGARIRGSLADNCLNCPKNVLMCRGGQRLASECIGHGKE